MIQKLTDSEVAVIIDSLAVMRDNLRKIDRPTPNIESALDKIFKMVTPTTYGLTLADEAVLDHTTYENICGDVLHGNVPSLGTAMMDYFSNA